LLPQFTGKERTAIVNDLPLLYLNPGEVQLVREPSLLKTILGSCVGVTFRCARLGLGALCHGILPTCPPGTDGVEDYRYIDFAIRDLINRFEMLGARRSEIEVKVFGGADVMAVLATSSARPTVGAQNCRKAKEVLRDEGLKILAFDIGGPVGRVIEFDTSNGDVLVRTLGPALAENQQLNYRPTTAHERIQ
jgi:chemotaxis protein CheD